MTEPSLAAGAHLPEAKRDFSIRLAEAGRG